MSEFLKRVVFFAVGVMLFVALAAPAVAFLTVSERSEWPGRRLGPLSQINDVPRLVPLMRIRKDGAQLRTEPDGHAFVVRAPNASEILAFAPSHRSGALRIAIAYDAQHHAFRSVCRKVLFNLDGTLRDVNSRDVADDLEPLPVKIQAGEVWIEDER